MTHMCTVSTNHTILRSLSMNVNWFATTNDNGVSLERKTFKINKMFRKLEVKSC